VRHELRLHGLADELVLDAFSEQEVAEYVARRVPAFAVDESFVRALHGRTEGLPLFVADMVNDLVAHGEFATGGEAPALRRLQSTAIPETLTGIIEGYLRKLTPDQRALLDVASACGVQFQLNTVAGVLGRDVESLAESCAELARPQRWLSEIPLGQHLPVTEAAYAFRHSLYREVLYQRLGEVARVELHRRVGAFLARSRDCGDSVGAAELALHFQRGHEPLQAARYYAEAAESALLRFGPAEAMRLTEEALAILPQVEPASERTTLELTLATLQGISAAHLLGFSSAEAKHAFQRAQALLHETPQHRLRGPLLHELGYILYLRGELDEVVSLAERTEALAVATQDQVLLRCACVMHATEPPGQAAPCARMARAHSAERGVR
jgi:predicted ATPase